MRALKSAFEWLLWNCRFLTLIAVLASLYGALAIFYVAAVDAVVLAGSVREYGSAHLTAAARFQLRTGIVTSVAGFIDGFLFALVLLIFAIGIYELFVSDLKIVESQAAVRRILVVKNLDDLKERLAKVILLILIVRYFEYALHTDPESALDVLYLGIGIALIAIALYLSKPKPD